MNSGDTHIVEMLDVIAHQFGRDQRLFRHRNIARPGGNDGNHPLAILLRIALQDNRPRQFSKFRVANLFLHRGKLLCIRPRRQHVSTMFRQPRENPRHLRRRFALTENNFRHSGAQHAMMIHLREAEILKRKVPQARHCLIGRKFALAYLLKELANGFSVQGIRLAFWGEVELRLAQPATRDERKNAAWR